nr:hypothetical protein BaRGS_009577 [Batillaria attramentaria]
MEPILLEMRVVLHLHYSTHDRCVEDLQTAGHGRFHYILAAPPQKFFDVSLSDANFDTKARSLIDEYRQNPNMVESMEGLGECECEQAEDLCLRHPALPILPSEAKLLNANLQVEYQFQFCPEDSEGSLITVYLHDTDRLTGDVLRQSRVTADSQALDDMRIWARQEDRHARIRRQREGVVQIPPDVNPAAVGGIVRAAPGGRRGALHPRHFPPDSLADLLTDGREMEEDEGAVALCPLYDVITEQRANWIANYYRHGGDEYDDDD